MSQVPRSISENADSTPSSPEEYLALVKTLADQFPITEAYKTHVGASGYLGARRVEQSEVIDAQRMLAHFLDAVADITVSMLRNVNSKEDFLIIIHYSELALGSVDAKDFDLSRRHFALVVRKMLRIPGDGNGDACDEAENQIRESIPDTLASVRSDADRPPLVGAGMDAEPHVLRANQFAVTFDLFDVLNRPHS